MTSSFAIPSKLILIGFMGSGKSSISQALSTILKWPVLEMDASVLEKTQTKTMHEVFKKGGELLLRETEIAIAKEYRYARNLIISTGAGVVMNKIVLDYLRESPAKIIFLHASFAFLKERLSKDNTRPLFIEETQAQTLYDFRLPLYKSYADKIIDVEQKSLNEIAQELAHYGK